jgi:hypothetical protein
MPKAPLAHLVKHEDVESSHSARGVDKRSRNEIGELCELCSCSLIIGIDGALSILAMYQGVESRGPQYSGR